MDFVKGVAAVVAANKPADLDALMALSYGNGRTVQEEQQEMVLVIGENIKVRRFAFFTDGISVPYVHAGGKIGVLVNLETGLTAEQVETVGKDVAMQIAALNPRFWDKSQVDQATLDEEKKILLVQMENDPKMASKPEKVKEGIVAGKLGKFYKENCLLQQEFVKDNAMTVEQYIASVAAKTLGGTITFKNAVRFEKARTSRRSRRTSPKRSLSSWASKPQIVFERRTLSVAPARSPAPASGGPRCMARSVLPEANLDSGDSFRPKSNEKSGLLARLAGGGTSPKRSPSAGQVKLHRLASPDTECPALFHALRSPAPALGGPRCMARTSVLPEQSLGLGRFISPQSNNQERRPASRAGRNSPGDRRSWANKPQLRALTLSVRRFSMPARSPAPASGGPRRMARVLFCRRQAFGLKGFIPPQSNEKLPCPASRAGRNFAEGRSPSSWAKSKPQIKGSAGHCTEVFFLSARSPAPASGGRAAWRVQALPEAKP